MKTRISLVVLAVTIALTGCSNSGNSAFDGITPACSKYVGGKEIDSVKVTADKGKVPTVDFVITDVKAGTKSALAKIKATQTKVVKEGSGPTFTGNQLVLLEYAVFNSTTGKLLGSSKFNGTDAAAQLFDSTSTKVYCNAITGVKEGSIVAFATPANQDDPQGSLYVFDVLKIYLPHANGTVQAPVSGLPQVVRDPKTGRPGLIQPTFAKPTAFKSAIVIQGKGDEIKEGDSVTLNYSGWMWTDRLGGTFESSWDSQPATLTINNSSVIGGFVKALVGVKVGSQVIAVMPPGDAYGTQGTSSIPGNTTLLFVIDVLGINK